MGPTAMVSLKYYSSSALVDVPEPNTNTSTYNGIQCGIQCGIQLGVSINSIAQISRRYGSSSIAFVKGDVMCSAALRLYAVL